ncbi:MAG: redox-sensing transcriptional repressor Rex [Planctomycetes bacterium]|nr:redox-sensing transcriptional repressor Rex [Planctomycetota bacterium]
MRFSEPMVERLATYRRTLRRWQREGRERTFSRELADALGLSAAQVRRDLMLAGCSGSSTQGYPVDALLDRFSTLLDPPEDDGLCLCGVGHLGRALLSYLGRRQPKLRVRAAFDSDPATCGQSVGGVAVLPEEQLESVLAKHPLSVGVLAVPASAAQHLAERLVRAGVRAIVNFTAASLRLPHGVFVEDIDIGASLEKAAFFAQARRPHPVPPAPESVPVPVSESPPRHEAS